MRKSYFHTRDDREDVRLLDEAEWAYWFYDLKKAKSLLRRAAEMVPDPTQKGEEVV